MEEKVEVLEERLSRSELKNYILEEENSILRENVECLLNDFKNMQEHIKRMEKERLEIEKITSGKIYKILRKAKDIMKGI